MTKSKRIPFLAAAYLFVAVVSAILPRSAVRAGDSQGTDFWVAFAPGLDTPALLIAGKAFTTGTISIPGVGFSIAFALPAGGSAKVGIPEVAAIDTECVDCVQNKGVHVTASCRVSVYGISDRSLVKAAFLATPTEGLGEDYLVHALWNTEDNYRYCTSSPSLGWGCGSEFVVVAPHDDTTLTIVPTESTGTRIAGVPYTVNLDQGQTYRLSDPNDGNTRDLSGSRVTASKPVAVFGGHTRRWIPNSSSFLCCLDSQCAEIPSVDELGTEYFLVPYAKRSGGDILRVVALHAGTEVRLNGTLVANLGASELYELVGVATPLHIVSNKPVLAVQLMQGYGVDNFTGDGEIMTLTATSRFLDRHMVTTDVNATWTYHYLNLVVPAGAVGTLKINGQPVASSYFSPIGASGYSCAKLPVPIGAYALSCSAPFGVYVYSMAYHDAYAYSGGMKLSRVPDLPRLKIDISPNTAYVSSGGDVCIRAVVTNQMGVPQAGVAVNWNCEGVNPWSDSAVTDFSGITGKCYSSDRHGTDFVIAAFPCVYDADCWSRAIVYWLAPPPEVVAPQGPYKGPLRVFPNPFSREKSTRGTVKFEGLDLGAAVRIYTVRGLKVWEGAVEIPYILEWDGRSESGNPVAPGTYIWVAEFKDSRQQGTLVVE